MARGWRGRLSPLPGPNPLPSLPCAEAGVRLAALGGALRGEDRPEERGRKKNKRKRKKEEEEKKLICWRDWEGNPFSGDFPAAGIIFPQVMQWALSAGRGPPSGSQPLRLRSSPRPPPSAAENQPFISENYPNKHRLREPLLHILIIGVISREFRKQQ